MVKRRRHTAHSLRFSRAEDRATTAEAGLPDLDVSMERLDVIDAALAPRKNAAYWPKTDRT
jgi:hypothetical protein